MRALLSRKLSALGYSIGQKLKLRGVEATCLTNRQGDCLLLVSNVFYGPSWVQIFKSLEHLVPSPTLVTHGNTPAVLIADSPIARDLVGRLFEEAKVSRGKQVHLEGTGFVELESKPKPDLKRLALPLASIVFVVTFGIFWGNSQQKSQSVGVAPVADSCIVDLSPAEFENWLSQTLESEPALSGGLEVQKQTNLGQLNIVVENTIGSAAKVTGKAVCADGRERLVNHRIDSSGEGAVFELGS
jgi:hypothetical protein